MGGGQRSVIKRANGDTEDGQPHDGQPHDGQPAPGGGGTRIPPARAPCAHPHSGRQGRSAHPATGGPKHESRGTCKPTPHGRRDWSRDLCWILTQRVKRGRDPGSFRDHFQVVTCPLFRIFWGFLGDQGVTRAPLPFFILSRLSGRCPVLTNPSDLKIFLLVFWGKVCALGQT